MKEVELKAVIQECQMEELGSLKVTVNCLDAETGELVPRGVGSGLLEAWPPVQQSAP